jgi:hypothetical protein
MGHRDWFIDLGDTNGKVWVPFMAAGPVLLAFILVFLDDGITWYLINHSSNKLSHGEAYNWDTISELWCNQKQEDYNGGTRGFERLWI